MNFKCSKCAACCRLAGEIGIMPRREDGACLYLSKDNECTIYDDRPLECNIRAMADHMKMPVKEYYKTVANVCNSTMDYYNIDEEYRVDPDIYVKKKNG